MLGQEVQKPEQGHTSGWQTWRQAGLDESGSGRDREMKLARHW